jgi:hypothetical protein
MSMVLLKRGFGFDYIVWEWENGLEVNGSELRASGVCGVDGEMCGGVYGVILFCYVISC